MQFQNVFNYRRELFPCNGNKYSKLNQKPILKLKKKGFPDGSVVENLPANAGDTGSSPGLGRSHMPRSN